MPPESELAKRCSVWSYLVDTDLEKRVHVSSYIPPEGQHLAFITFPSDTDSFLTQRRSSRSGSTSLATFLPKASFGSP